MATVGVKGLRRDEFVSKCTAKSAYLVSRNQNFIYRRCKLLTILQYKRYT